jgi:hypothetical protein
MFCVRVLGSNGAENRVKGHESSKLDQKHLFSTHLGLIRNLFTLSLRKSVYVIEDCKFLKIRLLPSDHLLILLFCSVAPQHPGATNKLGFAVQLCTLRWRGHFLRDTREIPEPVLETLALQLGVLPIPIDDYPQNEKTRFDHLERIRQH